jgi:predicted TPR repeat methyltransferase
MQRYHISFPATDPHQLDQDEAYFSLTDADGNTSRVRFHDYDELYSFPGLYEQLFYDRLKCKSPEKVVQILKHALQSEPWLFNELRILDLGAGNGIVGQELQKQGVARIVGTDILPAAREAAMRDRPGVYDEYYDLDLTKPTKAQRELLQTWNFNCLVTVAALGFGDIPVRAFWEAFNLVEDGGWIAFNIKETFLDSDDTSGFSQFIKQLILTSHLDLYHLERYRHRLSIDGKPLYYFGIAARKNSPIPESLLPAS